MSVPRTSDHRAELTALLRKCVECGLCLPVCATWLATGNEVHSPRGRLVVLGDYLSDHPTVEQSDFDAALDLCIGCRACEAACPSGVPFSLLEYGQSFAKPAKSKIPGSVFRRLDSVNLLSGLRRGSTLLRRGLRAVAGPLWRRRLDASPAGLGAMVRLLGSVPAAPGSDQELQALLEDLPHRATSEQRSVGSSVSLPKTTSSTAPTVAFFSGCANAGLLPSTSSRLLALLKACGCRITVPKNQGCCGALATHTSRPGRAAAQHRHNREVYADGAPETVILSEAAGCSLELKQMDPPLAGVVTDAIVLLSGLKLPPLAEVPLRVAYHDPCHARHGQGIVDEPRALLAQIPGLELVEPEEALVCCGSGGVWSLRHTELSTDLARRKARHLVNTGCDLVVTSNPGCLGQIADGLAYEAPDLPILPLTDLLWYAWATHR